MAVKFFELHSWQVKDHFGVSGQIACETSWYASGTCLLKGTLSFCSSGSRDPEDPF